MKTSLVLRAIHCRKSNGRGAYNGHNWQLIVMTSIADVAIYAPVPFIFPMHQSRPRHDASCEAAKRRAERKLRKTDGWI